MIRKKSIDILSRKTAYDIWIGKNLLKKKNEFLEFNFDKKKIAVISDKNVHYYQYSKLLDQMSDLNVSPHLFLVEPGESSKCWKNLKKILKFH